MGVHCSIHQKRLILMSRDLSAYLNISQVQNKIRFYDDQSDSFIFEGCNGYLFVFWSSYQYIWPFITIQEMGAARGISAQVEYQTIQRTMIVSGVLLPLLINWYLESHECTGMWMCKKTVLNHFILDGLRHDQFIIPKNFILPILEFHLTQKEY